MNRVVIAVTLAFLASSALLPVSDGAKKPSSSKPRKEDVPYIKCQVCEKLAYRLHELVKEKQEHISPKKISEYEIIEITENVCNLKKDDGDWIPKIDIVEIGDKLELVEQEEEGICESECKTIQAACQEVIGYSDTDVAEYIYKSKPPLVSLVNHLCKDMTDACAKKPPPVPKDRVHGEPFVEKPYQNARMDKAMRTITGDMPRPPSGMNVFSSEDLEKYKQNPEKFKKENEKVDEEEEEEEDEKFTKNLVHNKGLKSSSKVHRSEL
ncbi:unnamed protein product [Cochlearia groenlandica]